MKKFSQIYGELKDQNISFDSDQISGYVKCSKRFFDTFLNRFPCDEGDIFPVMGTWIIMKTEYKKYDEHIHINSYHGKFFEPID